MEAPRSGQILNLFRKESRQGLLLNWIWVKDKRVTHDSKILAWTTGRLVAICCVEKTAREASEEGEGNIKTSYLDMLNLWCLLDKQVQTLNMQLNNWNLGRGHVGNKNTGVSGCTKREESSRTRLQSILTLRGQWDEQHSQKKTEKEQPVMWEEDQKSMVLWKSTKDSISRGSKSFKQLCQMLLYRTKRWRVSFEGDS